MCKFCHCPSSNIPFHFKVCQITKQSHNYSQQKTKHVLDSQFQLSTKPQLKSVPIKNQMVNSRYKTPFTQSLHAPKNIDNCAFHHFHVTWGNSPMSNIDIISNYNAKNKSIITWPTIGHIWDNTTSDLKFHGWCHCCSITINKNARSIYL